ncbi:MAG: hypothetical protein Q7S19_01540 [bacterium]|nr:hypothetical protein [bacterium]
MEAGKPMPGEAKNESVDTIAQRKFEQKFEMFRRDIAQVHMTAIVRQTIKKINSALLAGGQEARIVKQAIHQFNGGSAKRRALIDYLVNRL